jgi:HTH-type transcriptional regulator/antitoxin HigA
MIKNELQYKRTKSLAADMEAALGEVKSHKEFKALSSLGRRAYLASLKRQLGQLNQELQDYERLKSGKFDFRRLPDIEKIPSLLIQARIAKGLGQEDLARLLRLKKQQIQQYEATDYASASLSKIRQVAEILLNC